MSVFTEKLDGLAETINLASTCAIQQLAEALRLGRQRPAVAVGSGGSAIAAEFFAVCRRTLQAGPTLVQTPLEFLLGEGELSETDVWLFSARGSNPDILAAFAGAESRGSKQLHLVTRGPGSPLVQAATDMPKAQVHFARTSDPKDGFLATHSLIAAVTMLLLASDAGVPGALGRDLALSFRKRAVEILDSGSRERLAANFASVSRQDTGFILQDPRISPIALLIETSVWEAGLCAVQRTDFRNFAHGRHIWVGQRPEQSFILALMGNETRSVWEDIHAVLPESLRTFCLDFGNCGRFQNAIGLIQGLCIVEALGRATGIDPGRPNIATFAKQLFDAPSLLDVAASLTPSVRQKRAAVDLRDDPVHQDRDLAEAFRSFADRLSTARYTGLVVDYDGTIVTAVGRYDPPASVIVSELQRLLDEGLRLSIATGRGGSAGSELREAFPGHQDQIAVSYYNGAYSRPLAVDITVDSPLASPRLDGARTWLHTAEGFIDEPKFKDSGVQLTIDLSELVDPEAFARCFEEEVNNAGDLRIARSFHTLDICLVESCKTSAAHNLARTIGASLDSILCIGDSGAFGGNDHALLGLAHGLSVGQVCDRPDVCWSFYGALLSGPDALVKILRALRRDQNGVHRLRVEAFRNNFDMSRKREKPSNGLA